MPGVLTVNPQSLTITANPASKTYGQADPAFGVSYAGFAAGEGPGNLAGVLAFTTNEPATGYAPVGTYTIAVSGLTSSNYAISFLSGILTVTPQAPAVTANPASKTYGSADPAFSVSYVGFVTGEGPGNLGGTLAFTTNEPTSGYAPVGTYSVTPSGLTSFDYSITFVAGALTVNPAALTVTAGDASDTYGSPIPSFTYTLSGFAAGENATIAGVTGSPVLTTSATQASGAGTYTIAVAAGTLSAPNYDFPNFVTGTLTIAPAAAYDHRQQ